MGRFDDLIPAKPTAAPAPVRKRLFDDLIPARGTYTPDEPIEPEGPVMGTLRAAGERIGAYGRSWKGLGQEAVGSLVRLGGDIVDEAGAAGRTLSELANTGTPYEARTLPNRLERAAEIDPNAVSRAGAGIAESGILTQEEAARRTASPRPDSVLADPGGAFTHYSDKAIQSLPYSALAFAPGGLPAVGVAAGAAEYNREREAGGDFGESLGTGVVKGGLELLTEKIPVDIAKGNASKWLAPIIGERAARAVAENVATRIASTVAAEGTTEAINSALGDAFDTYALGKAVTFDDFARNMKDSFFTGTATSGPMAAVGLKLNPPQRRDEPAKPPLIPPSGIPEIDAGVAAAEAALDAAKANQPAPAPAAAPPDAPQPAAPPAGLRAVLVRPRPTAAPDTAQQDAAEVAALEAEMRSQGLLGEPQQAAAAPVTSRPRAPEESQQDRASRLFSENYELVVNSPNLADVPSRDIERASAYASRAMQTEARRGWNGGEVNKPLIDSLDREVGFFTDELRRRGRIGQAAPTADFAAVAAAQGMTPEQHAAASATTADIVPQPAADDGKVTVGPSQIAGDGVIAARPLAEGESVTVFEGDNRTPAGRYVNHADQPNTAFRRGDDGRTEAVATQPIPAGGEVTVDYLADPRLQPGAQTAAATDRRAQTRTPDAPIDPTDRRRADYEQRLTDLRTQGLSDEQIASVRKKLPLDVPRDRVTGFYRSEELDGTLDAGIAASEQAPATYAEVDFANLGGLNSAVGGIENANVHLTAITDILKQELDPLGATIIRKGGDEFGVIAQAPVADVNAALARARTRATEYAAANGLSQIEHQKGGAPGIGLHYAAVEIKPNRERKTILAAADTQVEARKKGAPYEETSDGQRSEVEAAGAGRGQRGQTDAATATENQGVGEGTAGAGREATRGAGQGQAAQAAVVQAEGGGSAPSRGRDDGIGRTRDGAGLDAPTQAGRGAETAAGTVPGTAASPPTKDTAASPVARPATVTINATRDNTRRLADLEIEVEAEVGGKTRKAKMPAGPLLQRAMQRVRILNQIMECVSR